jgi:HEAT repeat protein
MATDGALRGIRGFASRCVEGRLAGGGPRGLEMRTLVRVAWWWTVLAVTLVGCRDSVQPTWQGRNAAQWSELLGSDDPEVYREASWSLRQGAEGARGVLDELVGHEVWGVRWRAARILRAIGDPQGKTMPVWVECLDRGGPLQRVVAASALKDLGTKARAAAPALVRALRHEFSMVRMYAAAALGSLGEADEEVVQALAEAVDSEIDDCGLVQANAVDALVELGHADVAVGVLVSGLGEEKRRFDALDRLGALGELAASAVPEIVRLLRDEDSIMQASAAAALGNMGPAAKAAVPALKEALRDADPYVAEAAASALREIRND